MELLTVNDALKNLKVNSDKYVYLTGLLCYEFEGECIVHWPRKEQNNSEPYKSSVCISPSVNFEFNDRVMERWSSKRVVVAGTLYSSDSKFQGCGHMGLWPAELEVTQIKLYKDWIKT